MKIGIIGSGNIGGAIGRRLCKVEHEVMYSFSRKQETLKALARDTGPLATFGSPADAAHFGDVVFLCVPWPSLDAALQALGSIGSKLVISTVNPLTRDFTGLEIGTTTSAAEAIAQRLPEAHVVEGFLNVFAGLLRSESMLFGEIQPSTFYCGDDTNAKKIAKSLIEDVGLEAIDAGGLKFARLIEPTATLVLHLAVSQVRDIL
jgi:predicted dinucleotide-binding enzyme